MKITYTKLKSGEWGLRADGELRRGDRVVVTKKDGTTKTETVGTIVFRGNGVTLAAIAGSGKPSYAPAAGRRRGISEEDRCELCDKNKWTCGHCIGW